MRVIRKTMMGDKKLQLPKKKILFVTFSFITIFLLKNAGAVEVLPRLVMSETYNDNVNLSSSGTEQDDYITQLNPGLNINSKGSRASILFDYRMQNINYKNNDEKNDTYHQASLISKSELLSSKFYLDLDGTFSQRNVSVSDSISFDNLGVDERNRSDVTTYRASPYFVQKFGKFATARLNYAEKGIDYEKNTTTVLDSSVKTSNVELGNGLMFHKLLWKLSALRERTLYDGHPGGVEQPEIVFEDSNAEIKYVLSRKSYLVGVRGYENNEYPSFQSATTKGSYWSAGIGWSPTQRTKLELTRGERYFGKTHSLSFSHEKKNIFWNLLYREDITTTSKLEFNLPEEIAGLQEALPIPVAEVFLSKALYFNVDLKSSRSTLAFNAFRFRREYQDSPDTELNHGAVLKLRWKMATNTHLNLSEKWIFNTFRASTREDDVYESKFGVEYQMSKTSFAELSYGYLRRKSDKNEDPNVDNNYKRNIVSFSANIFF